MHGSLLVSLEWRFLNLITMIHVWKRMNRILPTLVSGSLKVGHRVYCLKSRSMWGKPLAVLSGYFVGYLFCRCSITMLRPVSPDGQVFALIFWFKLLPIFCLSHNTDKINVALDLKNSTISNENAFWKPWLDFSKLKFCKNVQMWSWKIITKLRFPNSVARCR